MDAYYFTGSREKIHFAVIKCKLPWNYGIFNKFQKVIDIQ